jgi:enamine deaminase RidA (YjgF/YER057c/UK114 family)
MNRTTIAAALTGLTMAGFALTAGAARAAPAAVVHTVDGSAIIASSVTVPPGKTTVYVSGMTPPSIAAAGQPPAYGDTKTQTMGVLGRIQAALKAQGMDMGDVVMLRVFLVADPTTKQMDFAGMNAAYSTFFGTPAQPNKPARITMQIVQLVNPAFLVEIEAQAAK